MSWHFFFFFFFFFFFSSALSLPVRDRACSLMCVVAANAPSACQYTAYVLSICL